MKDLNLIPLNGLRAVEAVLRLGGLRAAAEELGVTQGAVSQQIIKTEAALGVRLFNRGPRGLEPTRHGRRIAEPLQAGFRDLARAVSLSQTRIVDQVSLSVPPVFAAKWLVWRLHRFSAANPDLRVAIDAAMTLVDLDDYGVDACIRVGEGGWGGVRATRLRDVRVFPVCAPDLAAALSRPEDLAALPIIRDRDTNLDWDLWLVPNGLDASILPKGPTYSDASLCLDAAIAGQGVFLAWETLAQDALTAGRLVAPLPGRFRSGQSYWFIESARRGRSAAVGRFFEWLQAEMAALGG